MSDDFREAWHAAVEMCREKQTRIEALKAALRRVDAINDSPATFNQDIDDVVCAVLAPEQDK